MLIVYRSSISNLVFFLGRAAPTYRQGDLNELESLRSRSGGHVSKCMIAFGSKDKEQEAFVFNELVNIVIRIAGETDSDLLWRGVSALLYDHQF